MPRKKSPARRSLLSIPTTRSLAPMSALVHQDMRKSSIRGDVWVFNIVVVAHAAVP